MNIGLIIIVIVVIALILGPIRMMQPGPAQKNREKLRLAARARGVHFALRNIPQQADEQTAPSPLPVYFISPGKNQTEKGWMLVRANYEHEVNFLGWWIWQNETRPSSAELEVLKIRLPELPKFVRALSSGSEGICLFWEEQGGEAVLEQVIQLLEALKRALDNR
jgi:hypothetical protein